MRKFLLLLLSFAVLAGILYSAYKSFVVVPEGAFCVVIDKDNDKVIKKYSAGKRIIYQAILYKRYKVALLDVNGSGKSLVKVTLPKLEMLDDDYYRIIIPVEYVYNLDYKRIYIPHDFRKTDYVNTLISGIISDVYGLSIKTELGTEYSEIKFLSMIKGIEESALSKVREIAVEKGVNISGVKISGIIRYPSDGEYLSARNFITDINNLKNKYRLEVESLQQKMNARTYENENYYKELERISQIIQRNPDILKYIYIDKMSRQQINSLPADPSGYPLDLDRSRSLKDNKENAYSNIK